MTAVPDIEDDVREEIVETVRLWLDPARQPSIASRGQLRDVLDGNLHRIDGGTGVSVDHALTLVEHLVIERLGPPVSVVEAAAVDDVVLHAAPVAVVLSMASLADNPFARLHRLEHAAKESGGHIKRTTKTLSEDKIIAANRAEIMAVAGARKRDGAFDVINWANTQSRRGVIPGPAVKMLQALAGHADAYGLCTASPRTIAQECGLTSTRQVKNLLRVLKLAGVIAAADPRWDKNNGARLHNHHHVAFWREALPVPGPL